MNNFANANVDSGEKTWLTPPEIVHGLGDFDLDPCVADNMPWNTAKRMVTKAEDGLSVDWDNQRVWCNPPYGRDAVPFLQRMARHAGGGLVLVFARTDTQAWQKWIFPYAHSILFVSGRIKFYRADGSAGETSPAPSALVSYSEFDTEKIRELMKSGVVGGKLLLL